MAEHPLVPRSITVSAVRIEYLEGGRLQGTPLVLLHGFPDSPLAWRKVVKELDLARYRVVLPYLRGCGRSIVQKPDRLGGQTAALAHDLLALADAFKIERFHLAGHDWGARTAYAAAVLAPERVATLTGVASPYLARQGEPAPPAQVHGQWHHHFLQVEAAKRMLTERRRDFCRELWRTWSPDWRFADAEFDEAAAAWDNPQFAEFVLDYYRVRLGNAPGRHVYAEAQATLDAKPQPEIVVPTLYIQGSADACDLPAGAEGQEAALTAGYELVLVPGAGHFPHRENPSAVASALQKRLMGG